MVSIFTLVAHCSWILSYNYLFSLLGIPSRSPAVCQQVALEYDKQNLARNARNFNLETSASPKLNNLRFSCPRDARIDKE